MFIRILRQIIPTIRKRLEVLFFAQILLNRCRHRLTQAVQQNLVKTVLNGTKPNFADPIKKRVFANMEKNVSSLMALKNYVR